MNDVPVFVDHNVSVVSILDLQQIANHRIGSHRFDKVASSHLEFLRCFIAILVQEVFIQTGVRLSS